MKEELIMSSKKGNLKLTTERVILDEAGSFAAIPLDMVASCHVHTQKSLWLLAVAAVLFLVSLSGKVPAEPTIIMLIVAAVFAVSYFLLRRGTIEVKSSGGGAISVPTKGMSHEDSKRFVEAIFSQLEGRR